jgi:nitrogen regulatory protein PII
MFYQATKVTIIAERLLQEGILKILHAGGAKGYTIVDGSGQGEHINRQGGRAAVVRAFSIVRIEFIQTDEVSARAIAEEVAQKYFKQYSGIVYVSPVEVIRAERF